MVLRFFVAGMTSLAGCISTLQQGIESLNLSEVGLTAKGAGILASSLKNNKFMATSLTRLDLAGNVLKSEGAQVVHHVLCNN